MQLKIYSSKWIVLQGAQKHRLGRATAFCSFEATRDGRGALQKGASDPKSLVRRCRRASRSARGQRSSREKLRRVRDREPWLKPPAGGNSVPSLEVLECAPLARCQHPTDGHLRYVKGGTSGPTNMEAGTCYFAAASNTAAARLRADASAPIWVCVRAASAASIPSVTPGITTAA